LPDLLAGKQPQHAWIGIAGSPLTPTLSEQLRASVKQGILLAQVVANGPAARAGLRGSNNPANADIITDVDGRSVRSVEDLASAIDRRNPGDTVRVTYVRGGTTETADVALGVWQETNVPAR